MHRNEIEIRQIISRAKFDESLIKNLWASGQVAGQLPYFLDVRGKQIVSPPLGVPRYRVDRETQAPTKTQFAGTMYGDGPKPRRG
jgi:hypothetical protein